MKKMTEEELIAIRRELHQIPEIGMEEYQTAEYLLNKIAELPQEKLDIKVQDTAIIVVVKGSEPTKVIGWRTDMDALPITEQTGLPFSSQHEGMMHACGHDIHMTIALGLLDKVIDQPLKEDILFFFQPAEENKSGAKIYTDNGFLDVSKIDEMYGLHVNPDLPVGVIATAAGTMFAGDSSFKVTFTGKESHAALPHEGNDMIVAAASFIQQAQTIISRNVNPMQSAVITFGELNAGFASNILAGTAYLSGTIRTLTHDMTHLVMSRIKEIANGIAVSFQCDVSIEFDNLGYVPVVNDDTTTTRLIDFLSLHPDIELVASEPLMTAEDFGYILKQIPGTMVWLGVASEYGLHHPKFNPNEQAIQKAVSVMGDYLVALAK